MATKKKVIWWGRFDENYSRNGILRQLLKEMGWEVLDFKPRFSPIGDIEFLFAKIATPDLVWVPSFRQRDFYAARRYSQRKGVPLLFDPLISSYDKSVFENEKYSEGSAKAEKLRRWEAGMFQSADRVLADTEEHAEFYKREFGVGGDKLFVVPVGAEEELFLPQEKTEFTEPAEVLFYGSFVPLQGVDVIVDAARLVPDVNWVLLGNGKLRAACEKKANGMKNISFEDWVPYADLPARIGRADISLGIFGNTPKAARVIPNKFYQSLACARPIVTMDSPVYERRVKGFALPGHEGVEWVAPGDAASLAEIIQEWTGRPQQLASRGRVARAMYDKFYGKEAVAVALGQVFKNLSDKSCKV